MNKRTPLLIALAICSFSLMSQSVGSSPEYIKALTAQWEGERFEDGRPKVSDDLLERLKAISMEEAWGVLRNKGFHNQYEGNWHVMNPDEAMTGRVVTAQYMPSRPDLQDYVKDQGKAEGRARPEAPIPGPLMYSPPEMYMWRMAMEKLWMEP